MDLTNSTTGVRESNSFISPTEKISNTVDEQPTFLSSSDNDGNTTSRLTFPNGKTRILTEQRNNDPNPASITPGFNIPSSTTVSAFPSISETKKVSYSDALVLVNEVKNRLKDRPERYAEFLMWLEEAQSTIWPNPQQLQRLCRLFSNEPDLLDRLQVFIPELNVVREHPEQLRYPSDTPPVFQRISHAMRELNMSVHKRTDRHSNVSGEGGPHSKRPRMDSDNNNENDGDELRRGTHDVGPRTRIEHASDEESRLEQVNQTTEGVESARIDRSSVQLEENPNQQADDDLSEVSTEFSQSAKPLISLEDIELFYRIREHIECDEKYEEFLKLLNLYTAGIIDVDTLIEQADAYIGDDKTLFAWFRFVLGHESKKQKVRGSEAFSRKPDLNNCRPAEGSPSYRVVPKEWVNQPCSARDDLCRSVLNDQYVSHPMWASEDSGFAASKKNQYEEAMHRCEEERYEYDLNIQANYSTIAFLSSLLDQMKKMPLKEQRAFRINPDQESMSIYQRTISRVYGKAKGREILKLLYESPMETIPVVLKRLKQKGNEWAKAQRELSSSWREEDAKNFYRSLDYRSQAFKANDRKTLTGTMLVTELENMDEEDPMQATLNYSFSDPDVLKDVIRIVYAYISRQNAYTRGERQIIKTFMETFIPLFFSLDVSEIGREGSQQFAEEDVAEEEEAEDDTRLALSEASESEAEGRPTKRARRQNTTDEGGNASAPLPDSDVQEKDISHDDVTVLQSLNEELATSSEIVPGDKQSEPSVEPESPALMDVETATVDNPSADTEEDNNKETPPLVGRLGTVSPGLPESPVNKLRSEELLAAAKAVNSSQVMREKAAYFFLCNTPFYLFFRLFQVASQRLSKLKQIEKEIQNDPCKAKTKNTVAERLGLYSNRFNHIDLSKGLYYALLDLVWRHFNGSIDQNKFEDGARYLYTTDAHMIFTIDKLAHYIVRQIQAITADAASADVLRLFDSFQGKESVEYHEKVRDTVGESANIYSVHVDAEARTMSIKLEKSK